MKTWYLLHKWIGITLGVVMLLWIVTGVLFFLPYSPVELKPPKPISPADLSRGTITPTEALEKLAEGGKLPPVRSIQLAHFDDKLFYEITLEEGQFKRVNARTGEVLIVTPAVVRKLAEKAFGGEGAIDKVTILENRKIYYEWGPLPVYKVDFNDSRNSSLYITEEGKIERTHNRWSRFAEWNHNFHTFHVAQLLIHHEKFQKLLIYSAAFLCFLGVVAGYYITIKNWNRSR